MHEIWVRVIWMVVERVRDNQWGVGERMVDSFCRIWEVMVSHWIFAGG